MFHQIITTGRLQNTPKAIIFDFDDTLLLGVGEAWNSAVKEIFGEDIYTKFRKEVKNREKIGGIGFYQYLKNFCDAEIVSKYPEFEKCFDNKRHQLEIKESAFELLKYLKENGIQTILYSARTEKTVLKDVEHFGLNEFFPSAYCKESLGKENNQYITKPNLSGISKILKIHGLNPLETWMIGDNFGHDIEPALSVGCFGVLFGKQDPKTLSESLNKNFTHTSDYKTIKSWIDKKIIKPDLGPDLLTAPQVESIKIAFNEGKKLVLTVGVFDMFHQGHFALFSQIIVHSSEALNCETKDIFLIAGVQDQGRASKEKSNIIEDEETRIKSTQDSGLCGLAISRGGYPTNLFFSKLVHEINQKINVGEFLSVSIWVSGADQTAATIQRTELLCGLFSQTSRKTNELPFIEPVHIDDINFTSKIGFVKIKDRSTYNLSSTQLRKDILSNTSEKNMGEKVIEARAKQESPEQLTEDAKTCINKLYQDGVVSYEKLQHFRCEECTAAPHMMIRSKL